MEVLRGMFILPDGEEIVRWQCGHDSWAKFRLEIYGEVYCPKEGVLEDREECGACSLLIMRPYILPCERCGKPILPGEAIGIYGKKAGTIKQKTESDQVIGCMRWECGTGAAFAGYWNGREIEYAFKDGMSAIGVAVSSGKAVFMNDMSNPSSEPILVDMPEGDPSKKKGLN